MQTAEFRATIGGALTCYAGTGIPDPMTAVVDLQSGLAAAFKKAKEIGLASDEFRGLRNRMIAAAEQKWMTVRYPVLDMQFTERHRKVLLERESTRWNAKIVGPADESTEPAKNQAIVSLPIFAQVWLGYDELKDHFTEGGHSRNQFSINGCGRFPAYRSGNESFPRLTVNARVELPSGITSPVFDRIRRALAYLRLFDILLFDRDIAVGRHDVKDGEVGVLWAPTDEAWTFAANPPRPKGDPAILIRSNETVYLIGYFDTPDEKPISNLIREFSTGSLADVEM